MFFSAELVVVLGVLSRVLVLRGGERVACHAADSLTVDSLLAMVARPDDEVRGL
jgi:simple sugar transport system ATP-binding protein